ncbi:MAG TPA: penicillin-binding transpeptidase domain-containing protein [Polyangiaceae bacterium]|nr:penicillin-binding transpeptidase domain-containing protein [Polyangiaceae bacterium]
MNLLPLLLDALRGALILGVALAALPLLSRAPAAIRRALLLAALFASLVTPFVTRALAGTSAVQSVALPFFVREIHIDPAVEAVDAPPVVADSKVAAPKRARLAAVTGRAPVAPWSTLLVVAWALGAAAVVARLGYGIHRAHLLVGRARRDEVLAFDAVTRAVAHETGVAAEVAISDDIDAPVVAGLFQHVVLMPRAALGWSDERWRFVLLHELAHVARRDCLAGVLTQLACAMHWFDPLAWLARQRLRRERELAADEDVLAAGNLASDYAAHLLDIATASPKADMAGALAMTARPSELAERVETLVTRGRPAPASPALMPSVVVAVMAMAMAAACANPRPSPQPAASGARAASETAPIMDNAAKQSGKEAGERSAAVTTAAVVGAPLVEEVAKHMSVPSSRIELTIDPALQAIVDDELAHLVAAHHPAAATAIMLDPIKGELLAIGDAATARRAFVTGSTIKPLTVAAALEAGAVRLDQKFDCRPRSIGSRTIHDGKERGMLDVAGILEVSSNVGASQIFEATGKERFDEMLARLHLGEASSVELPNVARGDVPKTARLDAYDGAMIAVGEGLTATPLQMAALYGAFANRGEYVAPTLVRKVTDDSGRAMPSRAAARERVMRVDTAQTVMQMLERAVSGDQATGKRGRVQGVRVAGKTGTGGWTTPDGKEHVYASFIGIVPADAPRYVILVGAADVGENGSGPVVAAPAFAKIAARALGAR